MPPEPLELPERRRLSLDRINNRALYREQRHAPPRLEGPIDRDKLFICYSLAPLAHTAIFAQLTRAQQRRYNQLVGLMHNELICFFEEEFGGHILPTLLRDSRRIPHELQVALRQFLEEERQHTRMFRRLNRLAEPAWYSGTDHRIIQLSWILRHSLRLVTSRSSLLPMLVWFMLLTEERSLMVSRRYAGMDQRLLDKHFAAVYRAHGEDEARHVQIDWHLVERFYQGRPAWLRRVNAWFLEILIFGFFFKPRRANARVLDLLIAEFPELGPMRRRLVETVRGLATNDGYRRMMYSPEATPVALALFGRFPEFARLRRRLYAGASG